MARHRLSGYQRLQTKQPVEQ